MNRSSTSMAPVLSDFHQRAANLRSKILKNEEERVQIDLKLSSLTTVESRLKQREQTNHIQSYLSQLNQDSQRAEQRNLRLLNDITQAEQKLSQLRSNVEHVIRLKQEYIQYLESNYRSDRQKHTDDHSLSETTSNTFSRSARPGSLRLELSQAGLNFLLDYIEKELVNTIDKNKLYHYDEPTISQKREILNIANDQQRNVIEDLEPTTTSMVVIDQLPSTIRRTTVNKCLFTEEILSANVIDLDRDSIMKSLPEQDRSLWIRLTDHFTRLVRNHIMNAETLANKFAPTLLPNNVLFLHEKAKSVLKHVVDKLVGQHQQLSSDDESSIEKKQPILPTITTTTSATSSWLNKCAMGRGIDDDETSSSSSSSSPTPKKNIKTASSTATTPRANTQLNDSDSDFFN